MAEDDLLHDPVGFAPVLHAARVRLGSNVQPISPVDLDVVQLERDHHPVVLVLRLDRRLHRDRRWDALWPATHAVLVDS